MILRSDSLRCRFLSLLASFGFPVWIESARVGQDYHTFVRVTFRRRM